MKGTLIIYILSITSSYSENIELSADKYFDVIEFWVSDTSAYRIKTFSKDTDIHVHSIGGDKNRVETIEIAEQTTLKNYGDIIAKTIKIELSGNESKEHLKKILTDNGIAGKFEISEFVFWNPDGRKYSTKSEPKTY